MFFDCAYCENLTSLEGANENVKRFNCFGCNKLKSIEGGPRRSGESEDDYRNRINNYDEDY